MPIERLRTRDLPGGERADLEAALRDPARFHSDGKEVTIACVILPLLLAPLEVVLLFEARSDPYLLVLAGCLALPIAMVAIAAYGWRTYGRHGYAITSFGVVRIRGDALRVLRYADIDETGISERNYPLHQIVTDELEFKAKGGGSLVLYGFGLERHRDLVDRLRRHSLDSDRKKG